MRTELGQLLDDIEDHARLLPDDARLTELRETAQKFAAAVRASGASEAMADAEAALAGFAGTRSSESTKRAADILEKFLSQCMGNGELAQACQGGLKFQPALAGSLGDSIQQMLAAAGFPSFGQNGQPGFGMGAGAGNGFSARQNNLNNVGLYGTLPTLVASSRQGSGKSASGAGSMRSAGATVAGSRRNDRRGRRATACGRSGPDNGSCPLSARVADYFERIADETGDR